MLIFTERMFEKEWNLSLDLEREEGIGREGSKREGERGREGEDREREREGERDRDKIEK